MADSSLTVDFQTNQSNPTNPTAWATDFQVAVFLSPTRLYTHPPQFQHSPLKNSNQLEDTLLAYWVLVTFLGRIR